MAHGLPQTAHQQPVKAFETKTTAEAPICLHMAQMLWNLSPHSLPVHTYIQACIHTHMHTRPTTTSIAPMWPPHIIVLDSSLAFGIGVLGLP